MSWRGGRLGVRLNSAVSLAPSVGGTIMVDVMELPRARVNASMLTQFIDRPVCFVGKLEKVRGLEQESGAPWPPGSGCGVGSGGGKQVAINSIALHLALFFTSKSCHCSSVRVPLLLCRKKSVFERANFEFERPPLPPPPPRSGFS